MITKVFYLLVACMLLFSCTAQENIQLLVLPQIPDDSVNYGTLEKLSKDDNATTLVYQSWTDNLEDNIHLQDALNDFNWSSILNKATDSLGLLVEVKKVFNPLAPGYKELYAVKLIGFGANPSEALMNYYINTPIGLFDEPDGHEYESEYFYLSKVQVNPQMIEQFNGKRVSELRKQAIESKIEVTRYNLDLRQQSILILPDIVEVNRNLTQHFIENRQLFDDPDLAEQYKMLCSQYDEINAKQKAIEDAINKNNDKKKLIDKIIKVGEGLIKISKGIDWVDDQKRKNIEEALSESVKESTDGINENITELRESKSYHNAQLLNLKRSINKISKQEGIPIPNYN